MDCTGAGERTVKNWFQAKNGPNGGNLVELVRHSDEVLEAFLLMSGREDILTAKKLVDARSTLVEMLEFIDRLQTRRCSGPASSGRRPGSRRRRWPHVRSQAHCR